ncbi:gephyrin-like molybdotransferase receptor GlpR [Streptomyces sp. JJ36]|uniref:divisome protein SepX/GlpR n=1 Tax=Streptomyces sp. JJ36 TaxID=2736645 RepID=UPI001F1E32A1|nr:gephyrin-like molybdotransferase receptor GlpR [Streptomyces sp. JJ36]MCF6522302.1 hypothetical protein [Streptomyces sp. JJ36]
MSSSGLIYAVIVGAWAAYLVPMWLRRQDELNEARPTERFSTAIRLLSGKAAMERRYAKEAERRTGAHATGADAEPGADGDAADADAPYAAPGPAVDVRAFAEPRTLVRARAEVLPEAPTELHAAAGTADRHGPASAAGDPAERHPDDRGTGDRGVGDRVTTGARGDRGEPGARGDRADQDGPAGSVRRAAERAKRAQLLARRRRTTMILFLAFSVGAIVAAVGGVAFLWAPAAPAALLSAYIAHLRVQERRRFEVTMDRRRAEEAARRLREDRTRAGAAREPQAEAPPRPEPHPHPEPESGPVPVSAPADEEPGPAAGPSADQRALVERTDHAEWVDQERGRVAEQPEGEGWDPVPVPLPTYVSAPVAPRTARGVDLDAPDTWSSARSSTAAAPAPEAAAQEPAPAPRRERGRTPLFDQMADADRPRAANE